MKSRKIFIVANQYAGSGKAPSIVRELSSYIDSNEIEFRLFDTQQERNATKTISTHLDSSYSDIIVIGGDGTLNEAVNGLHLNVPLSLIPAGTGNDFSKNVNLGKTRKEQFEVALNGTIKEVDVGKCNNRKFMNGVGIGFDGQIVEDMFSKRVPILKGHAAYYYHVLRILGSYKERKFNYLLDEKELEKELILLTIGNGTTFGGGFKLMPEAKIDDGLLEICEIGKLGPLKRFLNIHHLSGGTHGKLSVVNFHRAKNIKIEAHSDLYAHLDGERIGQPPFEISILPKSLKLRVS